MSTRDSVSLALAPMLLRAVLSLTFVWAGLGKLLAEMPVKGENAALLANMGVGAVQTKAASGGAAAAATGATAASFTPSDFPEEIRVARLYGLALLVKSSSVASADSKLGFPLLPAAVGEGAWPVRMAWAAALTELVAGLLVLFGLLTRLSALSLAGVMLVAIWLTEIGPALVSGQTMLAFLPAREAFDVNAWKTLLWQFSLLGSALALTLIGAGGLSMDRAMSARPIVSKPKPATGG